MDDPLTHLLENVTKDISTGCWNWTASRNRYGYGTVSLKAIGGHKLVHVAMHELMVGPVPEGLELDHLCRNRSCCNPDHLEPVTHAENMRRGAPYWAERTRSECQRGHALAGTNVRTYPNGKRYCVTCRLERQRIRRAEARSKSPGPGSGSYLKSRTHCPQGHAYDDRNTYVDKTGSRQCRECNRTRNRMRRAARKQGVPA